MITKPMLAAPVEDVGLLRYPLIATPKLDGIRCLIVNGHAVTRKFKAVPNHYIRETLERLLPEGADGEILNGENFQDVASGVMSHDGEPNFGFYAFDLARDLERPYVARLGDLRGWHQDLPVAAQRLVRVVPFERVRDEDGLMDFEAKVLGDGFEGVCLRAPDSPYKCGRSTFREHWLLKLKRFKDGEAIILGFVEQQENQNEAQQDAFGRTKRSSSQAGKVGKNTLGKFLLRDVNTDVKFKCGTGMGLTNALRDQIWKHQGQYLGKVIRYRWQEHGSKDKPRIPVFTGFRDPQDQ